ncbi:MAG: Mur ligase family protein [Mycoplasmatales bacterium]
MITYIFLLITFYLVLVLFILIYLFTKGLHLLQAYQQSAYDIKRFMKYIKENYKYTFGINELLPYFLLLINFLVLKRTNYVGHLLLVFFSILFLYYNIKFFNISKKRYTTKLPLKYTWRVKRLIISLSILSILKFVISTLLGLPILISIIGTSYLLPLYIIVSGLINLPIENKIKNNFKKQATDKIKALTNLTVVGITGSYGKTSIKNIINDVLKEEKITLQTPSSFNTPMGLSITINNELTKMHEVFLAEMGAYYLGEIQELANMVHPKIGIVSAIGPQHLETFKTIENIQKTKMELIESLPQDGIGILNYDDQYLKEYQLKNKVLIKWYSLENKNVDLYGYDITYLTSGMTFKINFKNQEYLVETKLLGKHNIYNILAAILVADSQKIPITKILKNIKKIEKIEKRLELKHINSELTIIDDSFNGNITGIKEGVQILSRYQNTKILITPGIIDGGAQNYQLNKEFAQSIKNIDYVIFIGKYNKKALTEGVNQNLKVKYFDNFIEGYNYAINIKGSKTMLIANDLPDKYN